MLKNILKVGTGGAGGQAIVFGTLPVISRIFTPADYAGWVIMMAIVRILGSVACCRYELGIVLPAARRDAGALFWLCLVVATPVTALAAALLMVPASRELLAGAYDGPDATLWMVPAMVFGWGAFYALQYWSVRSERWSLLSAAQLMRAVATHGAQIAYGLFVEPTAEGLLLGSVIGQAAVIALLIVGLRRTPPPLPTGDVRGRIRAMAREHRKFLAFTTPYTLIGEIRGRGSVYVLEAFVSPAVVGLYAMAFRLVNFPVTLVAMGIGPVLFRAAAAEGMAAVERRVVAIQRALMVLGAPMVVFFCAHDRLILGTLFGEAWTEAGPLGSVLIWPAMALVFSTWMDRLYDVLRKQDVIFTLELIFTPLSLLALGVPLSLGTEAMSALIVQSAVMVAYPVLFALYVFERAGWRKRPLVELVVWGGVIGALSAAVSWGLQWALPPLAAAGAFLAVALPVSLLVSVQTVKSIVRHPPQPLEPPAS